ncbi:ABCB family ABC transporter ATP-binding protein/permease [Arenicella xantha]|uniref:ATP-binding cassette subfamily B protein n=1 Tax=Arenicella xantha TaxID=644221 RepID=A0A395JIK3_9GAMM|nr:ABC transporter ATP-binding protein/permease [Arenicella xantha]RBP49855.1 ATP-binding cassette subfamily B protein [Arenicella xantha]
MRGMRQSAATDQRVDWSSLKQLLPYLMEFKGRIGLALLCLIGAKLASVGLPFILKHIVDQLNADTSLIVVPMALLIAYGLVRFSNVLFGELRDTLFGRVTERAMRRVGHRVFQHLHSLDLAYHLNRRTGGVSRDIERGVSGISFLMRFMVFNIVPTFIEIGMIAVLLFWNYSFWFALIVVVSVSAYVGFSVVATEWRTATVRAMNKAESQSSTRAVDSLLNFETVKYFNNENFEADRYDVDLAAWEAARRKNRLTLFGLNGGQSLIIATAATAAMVLAASQVASQAMTIGDFVLINALMMQIFMPLNFLGFVYREMKGSMANIDAMFALLRVQPAIKDRERARPLVLGQGKISFHDVGFYYHADRQILQGVSFTVPAKQKVAIVGGSGSGKSTIMKLLFRFYDVTSGQIQIDGQNIADVTQQSLRRAISVVPQDTVLFNASIYDNIQYGNVNATAEEVNEAIRMAYLDDFIRQLPDGGDTQVGERGLKLSGGEKQRVAIARAILKKPKILVFDEATSSLDSQAEQRILAAMERVRGNYTSVVIAHRLSTIVDADLILVLDQGLIVEQGTHQELLQHGQHYAAAWRLQNSD